MPGESPNDSDTRPPTAGTKRVRPHPKRPDKYEIVEETVLVQRPGAPPEAVETWYTREIGEDDAVFGIDLPQPGGDS